MCIPQSKDDKDDIFGAKTWGNMVNMWRKNIGANKNLKVYMCPFGQPIETSQLLPKKVNEGYSIQNISGAGAYCGFIGMLYYTMNLTSDLVKQTDMSTKIFDYIKDNRPRLLGEEGAVIDFGQGSGGAGKKLLDGWIKLLRDGDKKEFPDINPKKGTIDFDNYKTYARDVDLIRFATIMSTTVCVWRSTAPIPYWEYFAPANVSGINMGSVDDKSNLPEPLLLIHQDKAVQHFDYGKIVPPSTVFQSIDVPDMEFGNLIQNIRIANEQIRVDSLRPTLKGVVPPSLSPEVQMLYPP